MKGILGYAERAARLERLHRRPALVDLRRDAHAGPRRQLRQGLHLVRQRVGLLEPHGRARAARRVEALSLAAHEPALEGIRSIRELPDREQARLRARGLQRAAGGGRRTDHRRLAHPRGAARRSSTRSSAARASSARATSAGRRRGPTRSSRSSPAARASRSSSGRTCTCPEDCIGDAAKKVVFDLRAGQVCLLENLRFHPEEEKDDEASPRARAARRRVRRRRVRRRAPRARERPRPGEALSRARAAGSSSRRRSRRSASSSTAPEKPYVAVLGGAKVSRQDRRGRGAARAGDGARHRRRDGQHVPRGARARTCRPRSSRATSSRSRARCSRRRRRRGVDVLLPVDVVVRGEPRGAAARRADGRASTPCRRGTMALDIGPQTVELFAKRFGDAKTIFWNGPMGLFEKAPFAAGTFGVARAMAESRALHRRRRRRQRGGGARGGRRRRGEDEAHLDRRRRVARAHRGEEAAGHRGSSDGRALTTMNRDRGARSSRATGRCTTAGASRRRARAATSCSARAEAPARRRRHRARRSPRSRPCAHECDGTARRGRRRRTSTRRTRARSRARSARAMLVEARVHAGSSSATASGGSTSARRDAFVATRSRPRSARGLMPIVCVGETLAEREAGETLEVVERQVRRVPAMPRARRASRAAIAYEPVWAIGTGKNAGPAEAQEVHAAIRGLAGQASARAGAETRILYGGSRQARQRARSRSPPPTSTEPSSAARAWMRHRSGYRPRRRDAGHAR